MKKLVLIISSLFVSLSYAQSINDALLFSQENQFGTARYTAMSGAFGALGGDLSAIDDNPAGSAVFKNGTLTVSLMNINEDNDAVYGTNNTRTNTSDSNLAINQAGGAIVFNNTNEGSEWKKVVLAFNYQQTQNFNKEYFISGRSNTSIDAYFLNYAQGLPFADIQILSGELIEEAYLNIGSQLGYNYQQAFLGYYGGVIDPVDATDPNNTAYVPTGIPNNGTVNQDYFYSSNGANSKFNINLSTQYQDFLYLGVSLNGHAVYTERLTRIRENGYDSTSALTGVAFDNYLKTTGAGFSAQFGAIAKIGNMLRLGASFQSPTWYVLTDEQSQAINSNLADAEIGFINFNQVSVFPDYRLRTPGKLTGSAALVFGKNGLLSFDYHYRDYNNIKLKPTNDFAGTNAIISNTLNGASAFNVGGEYRIHKWSLRGGYRFEESPYDDKRIMDDLTGYSLGLGYNFGKVKFDVAYSASQQDTSHQLYDVGLTNRASIDEERRNIIASLTFNF